MKHWIAGWAWVPFLLCGWGGDPEKYGLDIRPDKEGWGQAKQATVKKVLLFAAREIRRQVPDRKLDPILVSPEGGPILLYRRGNKGEYLVRLNTKDLYWCQYVYQFAHEFCHILCRWRNDPEGRRNREHPLKWFEESLCEMASLYTLRQAVETWKTDPPYAHWKSYYKALRKYVDPLMKKGKPFPEWFVENRKALAQSSTNRALNRVVAVRLLPFFEAAPKSWETLLYLNAVELEKGATFDRLLAAWRGAVPEAHRGFVAEIAEAFGVDLKG